MVNSAGDSGDTCGGECGGEHWRLTVYVGVYMVVADVTALLYVVSGSGPVGDCIGSGCGG